ncbi:15335_t:CDS:2 [Cetraspora pellucida]|uniref:15335_t:CDS:1 n=1 Tax=Cetraspora pellucida TaxID=1433469 RepID=A0A9N9AYE1_9GLOM|nr:15335_t:CDS:2 [Cetraspora pellucida]
MDLIAELDANQRLFENGKINEDEYNKRRKSIFDRSVGSTESNNSDSNVFSKPKNTNLYETLQLNHNATEAEIRSNYRRLASKYHPDKNGGIELEEWNKLSNAYQILSDTNSRYLYDNFGTVSNSLENKTSLNHYVGGDAWQPYIGNLEIGLWMFSIMDHENSPEMKHMNTPEQKEYRHIVRVSNIAHYLQDKLTQFPKQANSSEFESYVESLRKEALKLSVEPNGKLLLSFLGDIYVTKAQTYLNKFSVSSIKYSSLFNNLRFMTGMVSGFFAAKSKDKMNQDEINKVIWQLSQSEISSIACESCDKILYDKIHNDLDIKSNFAKSLLFLGNVWLEVSKQ